MPKRRAIRQQANVSLPRISKIMPFSLILPRSEMDVLRDLAQGEGISVGAVVRRAILSAAGQMHPEFMVQLIETEADAFLDRLAARLPSRMLTRAKRSAFKRRLTRALG